MSEMGCLHHRYPAISNSSAVKKGLVFSPMRDVRLPLQSGSQATHFTHLVRMPFVGFLRNLSSELYVLLNQPIDLLLHSLFSHLHLVAHHLMKLLNVSLDNIINGGILRSDVDGLAKRQCIVVCLGVVTP
jgi:hypothetical protein